MKGVFPSTDNHPSFQIQVFFNLTTHTHFLAKNPSLFQLNKKQQNVVKSNWFCCFCEEGGFSKLSLPFFPFFDGPFLSDRNRKKRRKDDREGGISIFAVVSLPKNRLMNLIICTIKKFFLFTWSVFHNPSQKCAFEIGGNSRLQRNVARNFSNRRGRDFPTNLKNYYLVYNNHFENHNSGILSSSPGI